MLTAQSPTVRRRPCVALGDSSLAAATAVPAASADDESSVAAALATVGRLRGGDAMTVSLAWTTLFCATGFELISTYYMHKAQGFSKPAPAALAVLFYAASFYGFNLSLRALEISVAYAVWSAVVMAALAFIGMAFLRESITAGKIFGIGAIIAGTISLSLSGVA